ncbi:MAG: methyltransferase [Thaumarchaeota archaeon]|jgi:release factor glutamine methyltransferase|nr:methyltransferase [Candidatus Terraquivivens yellowstonensis]
MYKKIMTIKVGNLAIKLYEDKRVYRPLSVSKLMANCITLRGGEHVLDLGTGSGFLAIVASKLGAGSCVATDISPDAVAIARANAELNAVYNIDVRQGNLYEPVENERFDLIISNPPMTPSPRHLKPETYGGPDGRIVLDAVLKGAKDHLKPGGRLLIPTISIIGIDVTARMLTQLGMSYRCVGCAVVPFSRLLKNLEGYIKKLPNASIIYDRQIRPCWTAVVFEAKLLP